MYIWFFSPLKIADERIRIEDVDLHKLCEKYELGTKKQCNRNVQVQDVKKASHGGSSDSVSWEELQSIDASMAEEMLNLAQSYGYGRDPPPK